MNTYVRIMQVIGMREVVPPLLFGCERRGV